MAVVAEGGDDGGAKVADQCDWGESGGGGGVEGEVVGYWRGFASWWRVGRGGVEDIQEKVAVFYADHGGGKKERSAAMEGLVEYEASLDTNGFYASLNVIASINAKPRRRCTEVHQNSLPP